MDEMFFVSIYKTRNTKVENSQEKNIAWFGWVSGTPESNFHQNIRGYGLALFIAGNRNNTMLLNSVQFGTKKAILSSLHFL